MTPLDAARRLAATPPDKGQEGYGPNICGYCEELAVSKHAPDCPWLAMPQIVEALEAASAVPPVYDGYPDSRELDDAIEALRAALRGGPDHEPA